MKFGQRGIALIAPGAHLLAYIIICVHPPYPVLVLAFLLAGFGNGVADAAWNAWIGNMANANEILGFLHGFYGLGGTLSPLIATTMITKGDLPWYSFYYLMVSPTSRFETRRHYLIVSNYTGRLGCVRINSLRGGFLERNWHQIPTGEPTNY